MALRSVRGTSRSAAPLANRPGRDSVPRWSDGHRRVSSRRTSAFRMRQPSISWRSSVTAYVTGTARGHRRSDRLVSSLRLPVREPLDTFTSPIPASSSTSSCCCSSASSWASSRPCSGHGRRSPAPASARPGRCSGQPRAGDPRLDAASAARDRRHPGRHETGMEPRLDLARQRRRERTGRGRHGAEGRPTRPGRRFGSSGGCPGTAGSMGPRPSARRRAQGPGRRDRRLPGADRGRRRARSARSGRCARARLGEPDRTETRLLAAAADQLGQALAQDRLAAEAQAAEIARQSDALKSALLQSVSHDLRTPLATIRAAAGTLRPGTAAQREDSRRAPTRSTARSSTSTGWSRTCST